MEVKKDILDKHQISYEILDSFDHQKGYKVIPTQGSVFELKVFLDAEDNLRSFTVDLVGERIAFSSHDFLKRIKGRNVEVVLLEILKDGWTENRKVFQNKLSEIEFQFEIEGQYVVFTKYKKDLNVPSFKLKKLWRLAIEMGFYDVSSVVQQQLCKVKITA